MAKPLAPSTPAIYQRVRATLKRAPRTWLITGVAGFIGSNLLEALLKLNQRVIGLDNFASATKRNLQEVRDQITKGQWNRFRFYEGDISEPRDCERAVRGAEIVLHQAALGSVPRSLEEPLLTHQTNVTGFLNLLEAARHAGHKRVVYASSSSVYGDESSARKVEHRLGRPLSPYAASKATGEVYANAYAAAYGMALIGLRYFNVFGPRQDPAGPYAAVIPRWISALLERKPVYIYGDGQTSRDFCYIENVVQANLLAGTTKSRAAVNQVFNIAAGRRTTLNRLFALLQKMLLRGAGKRDAPIYKNFRAGDIKHSLADISKARRLLGYNPSWQIEDGLEAASEWYQKHLAGRRSVSG